MLENSVSLEREETGRFKQCKPFLKQIITITGSFQKYSTKILMQDSTVCLADINLPDGQILDHAWIKIYKKPKKITIGSVMELKVKVTKRKRVGKTIHSPLTRDIALIQV